ncbi:uncharacterized protein LOC103957601 isoform X1 [Pyrus x bretschneideri]|uniref:uncharacterized protein LOC103957601 isoform X1 n=1 Tax=Pyrus x bretschneideri TaxID=225117 RepID=UPI00202EC08C|nr:uncharacterized protein LOC103957601 isoform X1 [Pyrus x bretschneideri]
MVGVIILSFFISVLPLTGDVGDTATLYAAVQGCNKIIYCATALSTISGDLYRVDQRGVFNLTKAFQVDDAIWAAENATLKAEMSGKKLMHSWNNLSSTLSFRRFKRGFGILQLYLMVLELPVYKGLLWQRDHVALRSSIDGRCCWSYIKKKYLKRAGTQSKLGG